jgi:hypothetical protein
VRDSDDDINDEIAGGVSESAEHSRGGGYQIIPLKPPQIGPFAGKDRVQTKS